MRVFLEVVFETVVVLLVFFGVGVGVWFVIVYLLIPALPG